MSKLKYQDIEKHLAESIIASLTETAVLNGFVDIDDLKNMPKKELKEFLSNVLQQCTNSKGEMNITIDYSQSIIAEANIIAKNNNHQLALVLYATAIEHMLNDIIYKKLLNMDLSKKEINNILRLDIESKRTWLMPVLGLRRFTEKKTVSIKQIFDKRNEFVHYKWNGRFDSERQALDEQYEKLCDEAKKVVSYLKTYTQKYIIKTNELKGIIFS